MSKDPDAEIANAERRGTQSLRTEPRARAQRATIAKLERVHVDLTNGCSFAFPARKAQGLEHASGDELAQVEILGLGLALHWEELDVDLSVPAGSWFGLIGANGSGKTSLLRALAGRLPFATGTCRSKTRHGSGCRRDTGHKRGRIGLPAMPGD